MKLLQDRHTRGRERDNRFVRACAVDMRMGMSEEPFYARSCRKNAAPEIPTHSLCEAVQSCAWKRHKSHLLRELRGKCRAPRLRRTVCASVCSRKAHGHGTRANAHKNLQGKCRGPQSRCTVCASLRSRIAHRHVTRVTLCENL